MDFFAQQWSSYRAVVSHDLMEHRAVAQATETEVTRWLEARNAGAAPAHMVDLGCGDLALLAPLLRRLPLGSYTGLDLTAAVLPLAQQALGEVRYPCRWLEGDLLAWASAANPEESTPPDILHSAFAIHHLSEAQKQAFLEASRARIAPGGIFIWADVFREPGESRDIYVQRYLKRIRNGWPQLSTEQQEHVCNHLRSYDNPADRAAIETTAHAAGWRWRWAWTGLHQAEAVAVLTPA